ncbi:hypothetical protein JCM10450v2_002953 [Rhodotorula kratochvilovae]
MPAERRKTTLTGKAPRKRGNKYLDCQCFGPNGEVFCFCDRTPRLEAGLRTTQTNKNGNLGRQFYGCDDKIEDCGFFLWLDELEEKGGVLPPRGAGRRLDESSDDEAGALADPRGRGGDGYLTPPPASAHMTRTPSSDLPKKPKKTRFAHADSSSDGDEPASPSPSSSQRKSGGKRAREPSPDWPDVDELEADLRRTKRALKHAERELKTAMQKVRELEEENQELLKRMYPEAFAAASKVEPA